MLDTKGAGAEIKNLKITRTKRKRGSMTNLIEVQALKRKNILKKIGST